MTTTEGPTVSARARLGYWAAGAGIILQLIGISWDALQHHFDPGLASREGVFSLTNPSHVFIVLGMGLVIAGVVWGFSTGYRLMGPGGMGAAIAIAAVLVLSIASAAIALATGGISGSHDHHETAMGGDHAAAGHGGGDEHSSHNFTGEVGEAWADLQESVRDGGTEAALDTLTELAAEDDDIARAAHQLVHALGRYSFTYYEGAEPAFGHCRQDFESGCYHGVLEAYLDSNPDFTPENLTGICDSVGATEGGGYLEFQCLHGLGHGLSLHFGHNLLQALHYCDALADSYESSSCYGGAFMENIIFAMAPPDAHGASEGIASLSAEDPLYPCNVVEDRYRPACYQLQSSAILYFNGNDYDQAFEECDRAPFSYRPTCYSSMGRDIAGATLRDPTESIELCRLGQKSLWNNCFDGVVTNVVGVDWQTDDAFDFCAALPESGRANCHRTVGYQIFQLFSTESERRAECAKGLPAYRDDCLNAALGNEQA